MPQKVWCIRARDARNSNSILWLSFLQCLVIKWLLWMDETAIIAVIMSKSDEEQKRKAAKRHRSLSSSEVARLSAAGQRHSDTWVAVSVCPSVDRLSSFIVFAICFLSPLLKSIYTSPSLHTVNTFWVSENQTEDGAQISLTCCTRSRQLP